MTLYCTECIRQWQLLTESPKPGFQARCRPAITVVTRPAAIPIGGGQAAMMPITELSCEKHMGEVMTETQQRLLAP